MNDARPTTHAPVGPDARLLAECMAQEALWYPETAPVPGNAEEEIAVVWALVDALEESELDDLGLAVRYMKRLPVSCQVAWASAMYGVIDGFRSGEAAERLAQSPSFDLFRAFMRDYMQQLRDGQTDVPMTKGYADTNSVLSRFFPSTLAIKRAEETKLQSQMRAQTCALLQAQIMLDPARAPLLEGRIQRQDAITMLARLTDSGTSAQVGRCVSAQWSYMRRLRPQETDLYADLLVGPLARDRRERMEMLLPAELLLELRAASERNARRREDPSGYIGPRDRGLPGDNWNEGWTPGKDSGWSPKQ